MQPPRSGMERGFLTHPHSGWVFFYVLTVANACSGFEVYSFLQSVCFEGRIGLISRKVYILRRFVYILQNGLTSFCFFIG